MSHATVDGLGPCQASRARVHTSAVQRAVSVNRARGGYPSDLSDSPEVATALHENLEVCDRDPSRPADPHGGQGPLPQQLIQLRPRHAEKLRRCGDRDQADLITRRRRRPCHWRRRNCHPNVHTHPPFRRLIPERVRDRHAVGARPWTGTDTPSGRSVTRLRAERAPWRYLRSHARLDVRDHWHAIRNTRTHHVAAGGTPGAGSTGTGIQGTLQHSPWRGSLTD